MAVLTLHSSVGQRCVRAHQRLMSGHDKPIPGHMNLRHAKHWLTRRRAGGLNPRPKICCEKSKWSPPGGGLAGRVPIGAARQRSCRATTSRLRFIRWPRRGSHSMGLQNALGRKRNGHPRVGVCLRDCRGVKVLVKRAPNHRVRAKICC
jgi:hypothetical protein